MKTAPPPPWTELEKALIGELTGDLEIIPQPFLPLAERLGLSHRRLLSMIRRLRRDDDRGERIDAEHPKAADRESRTGDVLGRELPGAGTLGQPRSL